MMEVLQWVCLILLAIYVIWLDCRDRKCCLKYETNNKPKMEEKKKEFVTVCDDFVYKTPVTKPPKKRIGKKVR